MSQWNVPLAFGQGGGGKVKIVSFKFLIFFVMHFYVSLLGLKYKNTTNSMFSVYSFVGDFLYKN